MEYIQENLCDGQFVDISTQPWYKLTLGTYSNSLLCPLNSGIRELFVSA
jgi:hypothetical protein